MCAAASVWILKRTSTLCTRLCSLKHLFLFKWLFCHFLTFLDLYKTVILQQLRMHVYVDRLVKVNISTTWRAVWSPKLCLDFVLNAFPLKWTFYG